MIEFLKESTFAVNDVLQTAWNILKKQYVSIAGLCFLLFLTWNISAFLAAYISDINWVLSLSMAIVFIVIFFTIQLTMFKYILRLIDINNLFVIPFREELYNLLKLIAYNILCVSLSIAAVSSLSLFGFAIEMLIPIGIVIGTTFFFFTIKNRLKKTLIRDSFPTQKQLFDFLTATFYFILCIVFVIFLMAILVLPFIYLELNMEMLVQIAISLGILAAFITWIRISLFPFFIIDRHAKPFQSIKFSLAITRGNFTRLVLLLGVLALFNGMSFYLINQDYPILGTIVSIINSFVLVPMSGVATAVAYRQMMSDYTGDKNPDIMGNII